MRIFFDRECFLCRNLAFFLSQRLPSVVEFLPLEDGNAKILTVEDDFGQKYQDDDAWLFLIQYLPVLKELEWIAGKLGLGGQGFAKKINKTTSYIKSLCRKC